MTSHNLHIQSNINFSHIALSCHWESKYTRMHRLGWKWMWWFFLQNCHTEPGNEQVCGVSSTSTRLLIFDYPAIIIGRPNVRKGHRAQSPPVRRHEGNLLVRNYHTLPLLIWLTVSSTITHLMYLVTLLSLGDPILRSGTMHNHTRLEASGGCVG